MTKEPSRYLPHISPSLVIHMKAGIQSYSLIVFYLLQALACMVWVWFGFGFRFRDLVFGFRVLPGRDYSRPKTSGFPRSRE